MWGRLVIKQLFSLPAILAASKIEAQDSAGQHIDNDCGMIVAPQSQDADWCLPTRAAAFVALQTGPLSKSTIHVGEVLQTWRCLCPWPTTRPPGMGRTSRPQLRAYCTISYCPGGFNCDAHSPLQARPTSSREHATVRSDASASRSRATPPQSFHAIHQLDKTSEADADWLLARAVRTDRWEKEAFWADGPLTVVFSLNCFYLGSTQLFSCKMSPSSPSSLRLSAEQTTSPTRSSPAAAAGQVVQRAIVLVMAESEPPIFA